MFRHLCITLRHSLVVHTNGTLVIKWFTFHDLSESSNLSIVCNSRLYKVSISPVTGLQWPRGFQEVKVPRFRDNGTGWW